MDFRRLRKSSYNTRFSSGVLNTLCSHALRTTFNVCTQMLWSSAQGLLQHYVYLLSGLNLVTRLRKTLVYLSGSLSILESFILVGNSSHSVRIRPHTNCVRQPHATQTNIVTRICHSDRTKWVSDVCSELQAAILGLVSKLGGYIYIVDPVRIMQRSMIIIGASIIYYLWS